MLLTYDNSYAIQMVRLKLHFNGFIYSRIRLNTINPLNGSGSTPVRSTQT